MDMASFALDAVDMKNVRVLIVGTCPTVAADVCPSMECQPGTTRSLMLGLLFSLPFRPGYLSSTFTGAFPAQQRLFFRY